MHVGIVNAQMSLYTAQYTMAKCPLMCFTSESEQISSASLYTQSSNKDKATRMTCSAHACPEGTTMHRHVMTQCNLLVQVYNRVRMGSKHSCDRKDALHGALHFHGPCIQ